MDGQTANAEISFEEQVGRLEEIIRVLEVGDVALAQSLALFEEGVQIVQRCTQLLGGAEARIELLLATKQDEEPEIIPLIPEESKGV